MGGAQPLAVTMNDGVVLCVEVDRAHAERRLQTGYLDQLATDLEDAMRRSDAAREAGEPLAVGVIANAAEAFHTILDSGLGVDVVTDQTSAHDPLNGYIPAGLD